MKRRNRISFAFGVATTYTFLFLTAFGWLSLYYNPGLDTEFWVAITELCPFGAIACLAVTVDLSMA